LGVFNSGWITIMNVGRHYYTRFLQNAKREKVVFN